MSFCENDTISLIATMGNPSYNPAHPEAFFSAKALASPHMYKLKRGEIFLRDTFAVEHVFILLQGSARVLVYSHTGKMAVVEAVEAPHIFGATECIAQRESYGASVQATTPALVAKLSRKEYLHVIHTNQEAANITIHYLAWLAMRNMDKSELKAITQPIEMLVRYLYLEAYKKPLPHTVTTTRKNIADELHINLRTLYRYIARLEQQGYLQVRHSKLVITQECFARLQAEYQKLEVTE